MLPRHQWRAAVVAVLVLLLPSAAVADREAGRIVGHDGVLYESSPLVIEAPGGDLFFGMEYDYACALGGRLFKRGMKALGRLARVIEKSGRRAVFTVAPAKADIVREKLPASELPQGSCDTAGLNSQRGLLNSFPDDNYVSARKVVAKDPRQTYWKTDLHWSEVGVSDWAVALAGDLDPRLARRQRYRDVTKTQVGFLNIVRGVDVPETLATVEYAGGVEVQTARDSPLAVGSEGDDIRWRSTPARKTWPGHTLLLGDSFTMVGLESLGPLFRHGWFLWNKDDNEEVIAKAVAASDTVVIEVYQTFLLGSPLGSIELCNAVKKELRQHPRPTGTRSSVIARTTAQPR